MHYHLELSEIEYLYPIFGLSSLEKPICLFIYLFKGKSHCLDSGLMVPLPARLCFECGKSCKRAPLVACDYCPLYFHQDCLDPPLTAFPAGRWMCPNHPNHFIDQNLLNTCKATTRMKLWDQFANRRIDQHAVKLEFLRKVYAANPPFRVKFNVSGKPRVKVPDTIKYHYANPPEIEAINSYRPITVIRPLFNNGDEASEEANARISESPNEMKNGDCKSEQSVEKIENDEVVVGDKSKSRSPKKSTGRRSREEESLKIEKSRVCRPEFGYSVKEGIKLLDRPVLEALAQQRLEQIINPLGEEYEHVNCGFQARAALFPLSRKPGPPAFMISRTMTIGNGPNCDVTLSKYGNCDCTSSKHAVIFFDEVSINFFKYFCSKFINSILELRNFIAKISFV